jgi:murein tripeptide amidase MpaA
VVARRDRRPRKREALGLPLAEKSVDGTAVSKKLATQAASGYTVFRSYSEPGGIKDELIAIAKQYPKLAKLESIGTTNQGKTILALKVTKDATRIRDGARPSVLYTSTQHAREWITPEMNRRLLRHYLENYGRDQQIKRIVDSTELWFVPVVNVDGYDYTFTEGHRLWRKNLRDNDGDGQITGADGVDPNRNFPTDYWGYDNEGSSPSFGSETYRGAGPGSEPETKAQVNLLRKIKPKFQVNYHSAAQLLLYGVGWQVSTRSPDDILAETLAGDDAHPRSRATTRTSPPSSTRPTATRSSTRTRRRGRSRSRRRCRPARRRAPSTPTTRSIRPTARASSISRTPRR